MFNIDSIHSEIQNFVEAHNTDYIDAVLHYCTEHNIEIETIGAIISKDPNFSAKIQTEAEQLHYLKKISVLPI